MRVVQFIFLSLFSFSGLAQIPDGYYTNAEGKQGTELKSALYIIIKGHTTYPYTSSSTDTWDILKETDRDPNNPNNVIGIYSRFSMNAAHEYNSGSGWSREHVWAQSRGDLGTSRGPGTDIHHLRAEDVSTNSARSNRNFVAECDRQYIDGSGATPSYSCSNEYSWEPPDEVKGDIARMLFYMATRYEGENGEPDLELTEVLQSQTDSAPLHAVLSVLLVWHEADPVSQTEITRNNIIYTYQNNRNPYIDHPEYVDLIWGTPDPDEPDPDEPVLSTSNPSVDFLVYPNPSNGHFTIQSANPIAQILVYDSQSKLILSLDSNLSSFSLVEYPSSSFFVKVYLVNSQKPIYFHISTF